MVLARSNIFSRWQSTRLYYDKKELDLDLANCTEFLFALLQFVSVMIIFMKFFGLMHAIIYYHKLTQSTGSECNEELQLTGAVRIDSAKHYCCYRPQLLKGC